MYIPTSLILVALGAFAIYKLVGIVDGLRTCWKQQKCLRETGWYWPSDTDA